MYGPFFAPIPKLKCFLNVFQRKSVCNDFISVNHSIDYHANAFFKITTHINISPWLGHIKL